MYSCANVLSFVDKTGQHVHSITSAGRGIGPVAVSQTANLIAYAEVTLEPLIHILRYPECSVTLSLKGQARDVFNSENVGQTQLVHFAAGDAKLEYLSLAFSMEGDKLVSLSGVPDFLLTIW